MDGLTKRQHDVLEFVKAYIGEHGYSPSFGEIADGVGLKAKSGVVRILRGLEERQRIKMLPYRRRSITVLEQEP